MEILNSYVYGYSNGFLEGIHNHTKVMKRKHLDLGILNERGHEYC